MDQSARGSAAINEKTGAVRQHKTLWEAVTWAYGEQCVDVMMERSLYDIEALADGAMIQGRSADGVAVMMERGQLGCRVDGGSGALPIADMRCHDDACTLHEVVLGLASDAAALLVRYGYKGEQPEPCYLQPAPHMTHPDLQNRDKTLRDRYEVAVINDLRVPYKVAVAERVPDQAPIYELRGRKGKVCVGYRDVMVDVTYSPLEWWPPIEVIEMDNHIHASWIRAMRKLWQAVQGVEFQSFVLMEIGFEVPETTPTPIRPPALLPRKTVVQIDLKPATGVDWSGEQPRLRERHARATHAA